jgi:hypothetical protein
MRRFTMALALCALVALVIFALTTYYAPLHGR